MTGLLTGKVCLITGASRGIGEAIALTFAKENAKLILSSRNKLALNLLAERCLASNAEDCTTISADLSTIEGIQQFINELNNNKIAKLGIDVLVNNAGILNMDGVSTLSADINEWSSIMNVNTLAPMYITNFCSPHMIQQKNGIIINIGSIAGVETMTVNGIYSASKWALNGYSNHCQVNLKPYNIKVMIINPGYVNTEMVKNAPIDFDKVIQPDDISEIALLPFRTSAGCCPSSVTVRIAGNVTKS